MNHIREAKIKYNDAKDHYRWIKRIHKSFKLLEKFFKSRPIEVHEWCSFEPDGSKYDGPCYLDVQIRLPGFRSLKQIFNLWLFKERSLINWFKDTVKNWKDIIPFGFDYRWIFTVESVNTIDYISLEDLHTSLYFDNKKCHNDEFLKLGDNRKGFIDWLDQNYSDVVGDNGFAMDYDTVLTNQKCFTKDDVVKYTRVWLQKFYPELAKREIIFVERPY